VLMVGEEAAGAQMLTALPRTGCEVVAVLSSGGGAAKRNTSLASVGRQMGYTVWPARLVKDPEFAKTVRSHGIDLIVNVHSRYIVHPDVIDACRIGAFNMHPGPLPQYAGLNCVSWALYRGEPTYAVTIHWMVEEIDAGDIAYQLSFPIEPHDTPVSLTHKCVKAGVPQMIKLVELAVQDPGAIPKVRQNLALREYFGKEIPGSGWVSWNRRAGDIVNFVRACDYSPFLSPWGLPRATWEDREIAVVKADRTHQSCSDSPGTVGRCDDSGVLVATADEWISVRRLKIDGMYVAPQGLLHPGARLQAGSTEPESQQLN
jgi:methionyl-tRNA formyltransferase